MGKKFFGVIAFVAIAAAASWNYQQNKQEFKLSDLALENVEALAWDENKSNYHLFPCPSSSGNECRFKDSERPECYGQRIVDSHVQITILLFMHNLH